MNLILLYRIQVGNGVSHKFSLRYIHANDRGKSRMTVQIPRMIAAGGWYGVVG